MPLRPFGCSYRQVRSTAITTVTARRAMALCARLPADVANRPSRSDDSTDIAPGDASADAGRAGTGS